MARIVGKVSLPYDFYEFLKYSFECEAGKQKIRRSGERDRLELERDKIQTRLKKAYEDKIDGLVSQKFFAGIYSDYQRQIDAVEYRLANLSEDMQEDIDLAMKTIELSHQAESLYLRANSSQKRRLLKSLLSNCHLKGTTLYPTYKKPFDIFAKGIETNNMRG